jgi:hypothetical protein
MHGSHLVWIMGMAVGASVFIIPARVTALAVVFGNLAMVQGEGMDAEAGRLPGVAGMAAGTVQAKLAGVNSRLDMASGAFGRCAGQHRWHVTTGARLAFMPAIQGEDTLMIKGHHRIMAVVALGAAITIEGRVIGREEEIGCCMACPAVNQGRLIALAGMTIFAHDRAIIEISLVPGQAILGQQVVPERL